MGNRTAVDITIDASDLERIKSLLSPREFSGVQKSALRYAASSVKPAVGKGVSSRYGITSTRIKDDTRGPYFSSANGIDHLAELTFSRKPPTGMQYKPKQTSSGLSLQLFKSGGRTIIKNGFLQTIRNGNRQLTFRKGSNSYKQDLQDKKRNKPRRNLVLIHGPSTGSLFLGKSRFGNEIRDEVNSRIADQYNKGLNRAYEALLRGYSGAS